MANKNKRMAVFAGCTYPGTEAQLQGPINDVSRMRDVLIHQFGFEPSNIVFMTDAPDSTVMPTGANIRSALKSMFKSAQAGDVLFFHFSGHGTRIPRLDADGEYEAIVPCDFNLILDEEFRELLKWLPKGAGFTFISDACISASFIDMENDHSTTPPCARCFTKTNRRIPGPGESPSRPAPLKENPRCISYLPFRLPTFRPSPFPRKIPLTPPPPRPNIGLISPAPPPPPPVAAPPAPPRTGKSKFLTHDFVLKHLTSVTKQNASHVGRLLGAHFEKDASPRFCVSREVEREPERYLEPYIVVFFSGSKMGEISVDVAEDADTDAFGALSNAVQLVLSSQQGPISNQKLATRVRNTLEDQGFTKNHSCLYCSIKYDTSPFLSQSV